MSPRRSSRARVIQPPAPAPTHTNSSTSSISSGRAERSTRSHQKTSSPHISNPLRSASLEDTDSNPKPTLRRTRSGHEDTIENFLPNGEYIEDEEAEEDDITRCICGHAEYQGLPTTTSAALKDAAKDGSNKSNTAEIPEELGGLFIQCDICKVWQHGGCVGILDEASTPDNYYCELCRADFHKLLTAPNGQKYSHYLPIENEPTREATPDLSPRASVSRKAKEAKAGRASAESLAQKRRSTMNSRDAAYDEAEQLRRAIEESKREGGAPSLGNGSRGNKRSRSDSEDHKEPLKRQRTGSHSSSTPSLTKSAAQALSSSDEALATKRDLETSPKQYRGAAAKNHREKEMRDQRERERVDAATRRKARSERRRGDESDPSDDTPISKAQHTIVALSHDGPTSPNTPPGTHDPPSKPTSHKKTGRPATKRGRVGRNQYTKDRDPPASHTRNGSHQLEVLGTDTPLGRGRSRSRSTARDPQGVNGIGTGINTWGEAGKPSKPKHMNPNRTSFNEMKRRVAGILEFVSRTQNELDREARTPPGSGGSTSSTKSLPMRDTPANGFGLGASSEGTGTAHTGGTDGKDLIQGVINGLAGPVIPDGVDEKHFATLTSVEMMAVLRGRLVVWQREFGVWGEK